MIASGKEGRHDAASLPVSERAATHDDGDLAVSDGDTDIRGIVDVDLNLFADAAPRHGNADPVRPLLDVDGVLASEPDDALRRHASAAHAFGSIDADDDFIVVKPILKIDAQRSHEEHDTARGGGR